jgi:predicted DNA-binding protein
MLDMKLLENIQFVFDRQGKQAAVQLDLNAWNALLTYLEEMEDRALIKEKLNRLKIGPEKSQAENLHH